MKRTAKRSRVPGARRRPPTADSETYASAFHAAAFHEAGHVIVAGARAVWNEPPASSLRSLGEDGAERAGPPH